MEARTEVRRYGWSAREREASTQRHLLAHIDSLPPYCPSPSTILFRPLPPLQHRDAPPPPQALGRRVQPAPGSGSGSGAPPAASARSSPPPPVRLRFKEPHCSSRSREAAAPAPARRAGQRKSESRCSVWSKSISKSNSVSIAAQRALSTHNGEGGMEGDTGRVWRGELEGGRKRKRIGGIVSGRMEQMPCCATRPAHVNWDRLGGSPQWAYASV